MPYCYIGHYTLSASIPLINKICGIVKTMSKCDYNSDFVAVLQFVYYSWPLHADCLISISVPASLQVDRWSIALFLYYQWIGREAIDTSSR